MDNDEKEFGVVWSSAELEIAQTGYVFETFEEAAECGRKGLKWFKTEGTLEATVEIDEVVGTQVDWTADSAEKPLGFWVDTREGNSNVWFDINGVRDDEKQRVENEVLAEDTSGHSFPPPDESEPETRKLVVYFGGWCEIAVDDVELCDPITMEVKTVADWLNSKGNIKGLVLDNFMDVYQNATEEELSELEFHVEDEDGEKIGEDDSDGETLGIEDAE